MDIFIKDTLSLCQVMVEETKKVFNPNNEGTIINDLLNIIDQKDRQILLLNQKIKKLEKCRNEACSECDEEFDLYDKWCLSKINDYNIYLIDKIDQINFYYTKEKIDFDPIVDLTGFNKLFENQSIIIYIEYTSLDQLLNDDLTRLKLELYNLKN
jgi:hypothetical protein